MIENIFTLHYFVISYYNILHIEINHQNSFTTSTLLPPHYEELIFFTIFYTNIFHERCLTTNKTHIAI